MKHLVEYMLGAVLIVAWLVGIVVTTGWKVWLAVFIPMYSWYVCTEWVMKLNGWI